MQNLFELVEERRPFMTPTDRLAAIAAICTEMHDRSCHPADTTVEASFLALGVIYAIAAGAEPQGD